MSRNPAAAKRRKLSKKKKNRGLKMPTFDWDAHLAEKHEEMLRKTKELIDTHNKSFKAQFLSTPTRRTHTMPVIDFSQAEVRAFRAIKDVAKEEKIPKSLWDLADKYIPDEPEEVVEVEEAVNEEPEERFGIGVKVWLLDENGKYGPSSGNPVKGTDHECEGQIIEYESSSTHCVVAWCNGATNTYIANEDLIPVYEMKNCKSIW